MPGAASHACEEGDGDALRTGSQARRNRTQAGLDGGIRLRGAFASTRRGARMRGAETWDGGRSSDMNEERLEYLLDRYLDGALAAEERTELEALLLAWPQARTLFWKRARFHALLRRRGREAWGRRLA